MGLIRKTLSISTLGLVGWRSKKELLRDAEAELESARADLERTTKKESLLKERLLDAERRAEEAQLTALRDARVARRRGARRARKADGGTVKSMLGTVRDVGSSMADSTRATKTRLAADLEPKGRALREVAEARAAELQARTRRARKKAAKETAKARKRALKNGKATKSQLAAAADEAAATVRQKAERAKAMASS